MTIRPTQRIYHDDVVIEKVKKFTIHFGSDFCPGKTKTWIINKVKGKGHIFRMASISFLCNGILFFQGNLPRV